MSRRVVSQQSAGISVFYRLIVYLNCGSNGIITYRIFKSDLKSDSQACYSACIQVQVGRIEKVQRSVILFIVGPGETAAGIGVCTIESSACIGRIFFRKNRRGRFG